MYETYFSMKCNPFNKDVKLDYTYDTQDFKEMQGRLKYLLKIKGIGLFTGTSGLGKTYSIKYFCKNLNTSLYKVSYLTLSTVTVMDFYRSFCIELGIEPKARKIDMFKQIQERIKSLVKDRKITPVIVLEEAQYLRTDILNDLKMLLNFEMDSKDMVVLIMVGQPILNDVLARNVHEALAQRIVVNYTFNGMNLEEVKEYITTRLNIAGINENIFEEAALKAIASSSNGSVRKLNSLIKNCLLICSNANENVITANTVMLAENTLNLI